MTYPSLAEVVQYPLKTTMYSTKNYKIVITRLKTECQKYMCSANEEKYLYIDES